MPDSSAQPPSQEAGDPARRVWKRPWLPAAISFTMLVAYLILMTYLGPQHITKDPDASWQALLEVSYEVAEGRVVPVFPDDVQALDGRRLRLTGFMVPLEQRKQQTHFLLSFYPPSCGYCVGGGPTSLVEVFSAEPVEFSYDSVSLSGTFALVPDGAEGVFYRLMEAVLDTAPEDDIGG